MEITDRIRSWLQRFQMGPSPSSTKLWHDEFSIGLIVHSPQEKMRTDLRWDEVDTVYAYKRDCLTMDQICLVVGNEHRDVWIEVREGDNVFQTFLEQLSERLQGFPATESWLQKVALPPFESQWTLLYRRTGSEGS